MAFQYAGRYGPEAVTDRDGNAQLGTSIPVLDAAGAVLATLYINATRTTQAANPVLSDAATGNLTFYADPGDYQLSTPSGLIPITVPMDPRDLPAHVAGTDPHGDRAHSDSADTAHTAAADPHGDRADATSKIATHSAAADPHGDRGYADTRLAALVNAAPAALDTLNELATALGDDANFAATMTTALAGKLNIVVHGATAGTARPAAATQVFWIGTVAPTNAITNDLWWDKTATLLKLWSGSAWDAFGSGASGTAAALTAQPWQALQTYSTGQVVSQAGALYTSPSNFTAGASFNAANWSVGVVTGAQVYEQNGTGQVIAIWSGNGLGTAASKIIDVALSGLFVPGGTWAVGTAYSADTIVTRNGSGYLAVASSTGIDPATDNGTHWQVIASKGDTGATGPTGPAGGLTDQAVLARYLADTARDYELATGYVAQTLRRSQAVSTVTAPTSGTLQFGGLAYVPGGRTITDITIYSATVGAATPTHQWFAIYDALTRAKIAVTADDTSTAWATNSPKTLTLSSPWTPTNGTLVYVGVCIVATTVPTFSGAGQANPGSLAPALAGSSTASLTDPTSAPTTAAALTAKAPFWAGLKGT